MVEDIFVGIITLIMVLVLVSVLWVIPSYFEARAFNKITGKDVSVFDAMFVELRVQEGVEK